MSAEGNVDIRIFFEKRFKQIAESYPSRPASWPGTSVVRQLTDRAAGLFIWAETVVLFLEQGPAKEQLDLILDGAFRREGDSIDVLYREILQFSFRNAKDHILAIFKAVVGVIVVAKKPLYRRDLYHFLGIDEKYVDFILGML